MAAQGWNSDSSGTAIAQKRNKEAAQVWNIVAHWEQGWLSNGTQRSCTVPGGAGAEGNKMA